MRLLGLAGFLGVVLRSVAAIDLVLGDEASVKEAASTIAFGLVKYYTGNYTGDTPGNLPDPYFWWECGAMFGTLIDYWALTGDDSYNAITLQAITHQGTPMGDFMPRNQSRTLGNDDQGFWGLAAMSAAETNFPNPPPDQPQWLALAQSLFNQWVSRWDEEFCDGGLRWQIFTFNNGYNYKNSISNGCFINIAARLARFTGNQTYADWAAKVWEWQESIGLISPEYEIRDGMSINLTDNSCKRMDTTLWTYNAGIFLHGAAVMYNLTNGSAVWERRVDGILRTASERFFTDGIMFEQLCEPHGTCDYDQRSFKGYFTRWLAATTQMVPKTYSTIRPLLETDAKAAARACTGNPPTGFRGHPGTACGFKWTVDGFDGLVGVGEQMNALSAIMYTLVDRVPGPLTADTGGTSRGNPSAGTDVQDYWAERPLTTADRAGAWVLTVVVMFGVVAACTFMMK